MEIKKIEKILLSGIKIGIFLILLTPLVFSQMSIFPLVFPKTIYFRILVEILFLFYLLLFLFYGFKKYSPKISPIFISVLIFIEILALSTLKSINPWRSFWGTVERGEGFITLFHLFIFFLILVSVFKNKKDWLNLLRFTVLLSIPIGLAGIIQKLKIFHFYAGPNPRISATFGNPVFYGSYLVLIIFLAIFLGVLEEKKGFKIFFWIIAIFNSILLLLTGTRGAWIGAISGIVLFLIWFLFFLKFQEKRIVLLFGIFIFSLFFLFFLLFSKLDYLPKTFFLERYESFFIDLIELRNSRFLVWKLGINAWRQNPIFGFGPESFSFLYDKNYQASFIKEIPEDEFYDRPHNKIIDILVANGILGLLSYLAIFGSTIFLILKYRTKFNLLLSFILISLLLGYFVQNIFAFDTISSYLIFFLVLGFVNLNFRKENQFQEIPTPTKKYFEIAKDKSSRFFFFGKIIIALLVFFLVIYSIFVVNIRPFLINIKFAEGRDLLDQGEVKRAIDSFEKAFSLPDFTNFEVYYYSTALLFNAQFLPQNQGLEKEFSQGFQKVVQPLEEHLEGRAEIKQMSSYLLLAQIYRNLYLIEKEPKFLEDEERILGKALKLNPQFPTIYRLAGEMRFLQKREEEGMVFFSKAYELDNNYSLFNEWIGRALLEAGEKKRGVEFLRKALKLGNFYTKEKFNLETIWRLTQIYEELGDYQKMVEFYEETILRYPRELSVNPQLFASLATVYAKIGEKEKARQTIEKMLQVYPQLRSQAEEFLSTLD
jgi:O-antigen ligase